MKAASFGSKFVFEILLLLMLLVGHQGYSQTLTAQSKIETLVGAGDIASCESPQSQATAKLLDAVTGTVFTVGDNAYPNGTAQSFIECYGLTWGRHRNRTRPAPGNHDYDSPQAGPYFNYFGSKAGPAGRGYYSYNLGAWHIVSLNSNSQAHSFGAAQEAWLRQDLASNPRNCTLAYWHHPYFSSGNRHGNHPHMRPLFEILHRAGVSVLISAHDHIYERFMPQDPNGKADANGVRQFIVGTGGAPLYQIDVIKPHSEARNTRAHGVIKFALDTTTYEWEFIPIAGQTFRDRGSATCSPSAKGIPAGKRR